METCTTPTSRKHCDSCVVKTTDCSTVISITPSTGQITKEPGKCAIVAGEAKCVRASEPTCDPAQTPDKCVGNTAVYCDGLVRKVDCAALGQECAVAKGWAGCRPTGAKPCTLSHEMSCADATTVSSCCPPNGLFDPDSPSSSTMLRCVPGYEARYDCVKLKFDASYVCSSPFPFFAECRYPKS